MKNLKDLKYKIKYKFQRAKKGYCDKDLYSIDGWFTTTFPKMLNEFAECTCGCPCNEDEILKDVADMPNIWIIFQEPIINKILKKYDMKFNLNESMCCWLLIILRIKYCFEMCDECNERYKEYWDKKEYEEINNEIEKYKKEGFYLFEKYFFNLWW